MTDWLNRPVFGYGVWPDKEKQVTVNDKVFWVNPLTKEKQASIHIDLVSQRISLEDAVALINRFLSHLSWFSQQPYWLGDGFAGSAKIASFEREQRILFEGMIIEFPDAFELYDDSLISRALAFYREAKIATHFSLPYACLSFYKILEIEKRKNGVEALDKWINAKLPDLQSLDKQLFEKIEEIAARHQMKLSEFFFKVIRSEAAHYMTDSNLNLDEDRANQMFAYASIPLEDLATLYIKEVLGISGNIFSRSHYKKPL